MIATLKNLTKKPGRVTDSVWFWVMLFSCVSLIAMQLIDWKYNQRQAQLERQFQGREWAAKHGAKIQMNPQSELERSAPVPVVAKQSPGPSAQSSVIEKSEAQGHTNESSNAVPTYSQPGQLVISLRPLRSLAIVALIISSVLLWRQTRPAMPSAENQAS